MSLHIKLTQIEHYKTQKKISVRKVCNLKSIFDYCVKINTNYNLIE